ncbi:MAG: cupredoxin domain-containing protein [Candidatus Micrarchaeia archaeon]
MSQNNFEIKKSTLIVVLVALIAVSGAAYYVLTVPTQNPNVGCSNPENVCLSPPTSNGSGANAGQQANGVQPAGSIQKISIRALSSGQYDNPEIHVKVGIPVRLTFTADNGAGCGKYMAIDEFGVKLTSRNGEDEVAEFTPQNPGTYYYHCGMWMFKGKLVVE